MTNLQNTFAAKYLTEAQKIIELIDCSVIESMTQMLVKLRVEGGRLFILGVGGGAGNAGHAVNDFRKLAEIETYSPSDNVSELTARTNDEGWETVYSAWLKISKLNPNDMLLILSVGGGNLDKNISPNLVRAVEYAKIIGSKIIGIVGRDGGYTASVADECLIIPTVNSQNITPHTEAFQAVIWHLLISDPRLQQVSNKWESTTK
jgi:D-sedoheptulose 7-phosphate isomerase